VTYVSKFRPAGGRIVACYTCPEHGEMDVEVERDANGEAPDSIVCGEEVVLGMVPHPLTGEPCRQRRWENCEQIAVWTPTPIPGRVRRIEVSRGKWEKPERSTYLDTRELGEGQSMEEFQKKRKAVWDEKRKAEVMEIKKGFY
jgi:hypothetical protein